MAYTTIDDPELYFQTKIHTGTGSELAVTLDGSENMQPDFVWLKNRTQDYSHRLFDSVRGATKLLYSDLADAEGTDAQGLKSFDSDGFTIGTDGGINTNTNSIVSWNWKSGTSFTNDASSTSIGSIDSAGIFSNDAGFSIFTFTGTGSIGTIKHGLNTKPDVIFIKGRSEAKAWTVYHSSLGATKAVFLQATDAAVDHERYFNDVEPTTSVFTAGSSTNLTGSGITFVGYAFTAKQGYSKFGSYTGNGNADGTFVYTGFKPAMVICKKTNATEGWMMIDNKRANSFNPVQGFLRPNGSNAENDSLPCDFNANGFKWRSTDGLNNTSGGSYIYMAFAENPFVSSTGVPATAR